MKTKSINKDLFRILQATQKVAGWLWEKGWAEKNAGNISINITSAAAVRPDPVRYGGPRKLVRRFPALAGQTLLVTAAGSRMRDLARDPDRYLGIIRLNGRGDTYRVAGCGRNPRHFLPTSELPSHLAIQEYFIISGNGNKAVLHTHPDELVALTHLPIFKSVREINRMLRAIHPEITYHLPRGVGWVPFLKPGSQALGRATVRALLHHDIVLWERHGCLATGPDIVAIFDLVDVLNKGAKIFFLRCRAGYPKNRS